MLSSSFIFSLKPGGATFLGTLIKEFALVPLVIFLICSSRRNCSKNWNAKLSNSILFGADLTDAGNLTVEQLSNACVYENTVLPVEMFEGAGVLEIFTIEEYRLWFRPFF